MKEKLKDKYHDCGHRPRNTDKRKRTATKNSVVMASKSLAGFVTAVESIPQAAKLTAEQIEEAAWAAALCAPAVQDVVPPGWFTTKQLADKLNKTRPTMARLLADAVAAGRCEVQKFRINVGSFSRATPHYRPK